MWQQLEDEDRANELDEDEADKGEWEVVPRGHPAFVEAGSCWRSGGSQGGKRKKTSHFQNSSAQDQEMEDSLVKFQTEQMAALTADVQARNRTLDSAESDFLQRVEEMKNKSLQQVEVKNDEMKVNIAYLRTCSW